MSKKPKKPAKRFKYTIQNELPKLGKVKTEWELESLFYKSPNHKSLEVDVAAAEKQYQNFAKKYKSLTFLKTDKALLESLKEYKKLQDNKLDKVFIYLFLCRERNAKDQKAEQTMNILEQRATKFGNEVIFYTLALGKLPKQRQKTILQDPRFEEFWFLLRGVFESAKYNLTEAEERILSLKSMTSRSLWIAGTDKILNTATVKVGQEELPLNGALMEMLDAPKPRRQALLKATNTKLKEIGPVAENELNALILDKKISDELRGYEKPYSATVRSFDTTEKTLSALTEAVTTEGYKTSQRFYKLKAKLYGQKLEYVDRDDFPERLPDVELAEAITICRDAFYGFNREYGKTFDEMLTTGAIDVYPRTGKGGGAFCINGWKSPTCVMLNHSSDFSSVRTMAHEMGHALHAYRSKKQGVLYCDHSILTAETASTFFEAMVGDSLMQQLTEGQKKIYLNSLISDKISTMIMCIARYLAELEMHETIRTQGSMTWQDMSAVLAKHFKQYCGPAIKLTDDDGLSVIAKTHYRRNFYQFSYSFGVIASSIMYSRYQADTSYAKQVEAFLSAGEKDTVDGIFKEIGIDTSKAAVFSEGLALLSAEVTELEQLLKSK